MDSDDFCPTHFLKDKYQPDWLRPVRLLRKDEGSILWVDGDNIRGSTPEQDVVLFLKAVWPSRRVIQEASLSLARAFQHSFILESIPQPQGLGVGGVCVRWKDGPETDRVGKVLRDAGVLNKKVVFCMEKEPD